MTTTPRRDSRIAQLILVACAAAGLLQAPGHANESEGPVTAQEIVRRYVDKRGGMEKILAIRTLIYRGEEHEDEDGNIWRATMVRARPYYLRVGDPADASTIGYAEGNDGSHWEFFRDPGLVLRTTGAPASAIRHTAYFDDPLVMSAREPGFCVELVGGEVIGGRETHRLHVTFPDGFETHILVDIETGLIAASRWTAPVHAFGPPVTSETRFFNWRRVHGVLYPMELHEVEIATGKTLNQGAWVSIEANVPFAPKVFSPPEYEKTPLTRMLNAAYAARSIPSNTLGWYADFRDDPANAGVDLSEEVSAVGYQILKTGAVDTAILLLREVVKDHPSSVLAHFGLGRAYRTTGLVGEATASFRQALELDPDFGRASEALAELNRSSPP